jgi:hypothetical protein
MRFRLLTLLLLSSFAYGETDCEVSLNYGVVVTDEQIRVLGHGGRAVYQLNHPNQLIVKGEWIELDTQQKRDIARLSTGIHMVVPKMILLANEGVELAVETIEQVYGGLVKDDKSQQKLQKSLERVKHSVKEKFIRTNDNFYMGPGMGPSSLEQVDDLVDRELEEQFEQALSTSIGGILSAIGGLVANGESTEEKIAAIAKQLETMGENIEQNIEPKAQTLKHKAKWFCNKFKELDLLEDELRGSIPALQPFDVISTGKSQ